MPGKFNISYLFTLKDKFTRGGNKIKKSFERINRNFKKTPTLLKSIIPALSKLRTKMVSSFKKMGASVDRFTKKVGNSAKKIKKVGTQLSTKIGIPAAAFTAFSISAFNTQEKALAKVRQGLKSTNNAVGLSFSELTKQASDLQERSLFGDEEILGKATSTLLTFTKITGENFAKTQQAVIDLAARMDGDLQNSALQVGKALNAPIANLGALGRAGIQFSKEQKNVITSLVKTGRLAEAQKIILKELETQFGGTAEALAKIGTGPLKQIINAIGDSSEEIGKLQFEILKPLINVIKKLNKKFSKLSPTIKKFIAGFILLAIIIGPIVLILSAVAFAIGTMSAPILLAVAGFIALGAAIASGLFPIKEILSIFQSKFRPIFTQIKNIFIDVTEAFNQINFGPAGDQLKAATKGIDFLSLALEGLERLLGNIAIAIMIPINLLKGLVEVIGQVTTAVGTFDLSGFDIGRIGGKFGLDTEGFDFSKVKEKLGLDFSGLGFGKILSGFSNAPQNFSPIFPGTDLAGISDRLAPSNLNNDALNQSNDNQQFQGTMDINVRTEPGVTADVKQQSKGQGMDVGTSMGDL